MGEPAERPPWYGTAREQPGWRHPDGRLKPGHKLAQGNPVSKRMYDLKRQIVDCTTPEQFAQVMAKLLELATGGDTTACKLWLEYTVGKPTQTIEVSGPDGETARLDVAALIAIIQEEEPDRERQIKIARRLYQLGQQQETTADGPGDGSSTDA
jgi:hypothetical protein